MKVGPLRNRLVFQELTSTQNAVGEAIDSWDESFTVWGAFEAVGSREFPIAYRMSPETMGRFRIRYRSDIDSLRHRILYDGKTWNIQPPVSDDKKTEMLIEAFVIEKPEGN